MESIERELLLGLYNPFGSIVDESMSVEVFNDALRYFFELEELPNGRLITTSLKNSRDRKPISNGLLLEYLYSFLVWQHERTHFYEISSCPLGVFLFRSKMSKRAMIQRLFIDMQKTNWIISGKSVYMPIPAWRQWLSKNLPNNEITEVVSNVVMFWNAHSTFESTMFIDRVTDVNDAIDDVTRLQHLISKMLDRYFDVPSDLLIPPMITRLDKDLGSVPTPYCTTLRIMESYAKLIELKCLYSLSAPSNIADSIIETMYDPRYFGVIEYVNWIYDDAHIDTILGIMDLSLFTPVDSLFYDFWTDELVWEDIHPGYRLRQIASIAKEKSLQVQQGRYLDFYDTISHELGWPLPTSMLKRMSTFTLVDRTFSEAIELFDGISTKDNVRRSLAETYMFELLKELSKLRTEHQEFVGFPYGVIMDTGRTIEPFINLIGDV